MAQNGHFGPETSFFVNLTVSFKVEERMIAQNNTLDGVDRLHARKTFLAEPNLA